MIKLSGKLCNIELALSDSIDKYMLSLGTNYSSYVTYFDSLDDLVELRNNLDHIIEFAKKREGINSLNKCSKSIYHFTEKEQSLEDYSLNFYTCSREIDIDGFPSYLDHSNGYNFIINPKDGKILSVEDYNNGKRFNENII